MACKPCHALLGMTRREDEAELSRCVILKSGQRDEPRQQKRPSLHRDEALPIRTDGLRQVCQVEHANPWNVMGM